jgi:hypothetical protein
MELFNKNHWHKRTQIWMMEAHCWTAGFAVVRPRCSTETEQLLFSAIRYAHALWLRCVHVRAQKRVAPNAAPPTFRCIYNLGNGRRTLQIQSISAPSGVSKGHKPTIDTDSSVDPVPDTCILTVNSSVSFSMFLTVCGVTSLEVSTYVSNTVTGTISERKHTV